LPSIDSFEAIVRNTRNYFRVLLALHPLLMNMNWVRL